MKKIVFLLVALYTLSLACLPPLKPLPPIGCSYSNAVLVYSGNSCHWVYMNCGR